MQITEMSAVAYCLQEYYENYDGTQADFDCSIHFHTNASTMHMAASTQKKQTLQLKIFLGNDSTRLCKIYEK
jgi:hypothetical protein